MKKGKFYIVQYEFNNTKGEVFIDENITEEKEIKEICIKDYLENNMKITYKEEN